MRLIRLYQENNLHENSEIELTSDSCHRLLHVLRAKVDDSFILFDGSGYDFKATITAIKKKKVYISVSKKNKVNNESNVHIHLGQALAKGEKVDFILQKAVELGANEITLLNTERCNAKIAPERIENRLQHWKKIMVHACEQSNRSLLPCIHSCEHIENWLPRQNDSHKLILDPHATSLLPTATDSKHFTLLIGPEGGFSDTEIDRAKQNGFHPIKLGHRILRTETAALAGIAAIQTLYGDFYQSG